jgi:hypothetical protein
VGRSHKRGVTDLNLFLCRHIPFPPKQKNASLEQKRRG